MPNWCFNKITIRAGADTRSKIKNLLKGNEYYRPFNAEENAPLMSSETLFSFHNVIPQPDNILDLADPRRKTDIPQSRDPKGAMPDWYAWRVNNWGTKWSVSEVQMSETDTSLTYCFETAWAPPEMVVKRLSEMFPNAYIVLSFDEPGCLGKGATHFKGGEVVKETGVGVS
jgi:hypothetical protein